jgi:hypothetical protein
MPADIPSRVSALCAEHGPQLSPRAVGLLVRAVAPFSAVDGLVALEQHPAGSERVDLVVRLSRRAAGALLARPEGLEPCVRSFLTRWLAPGEPVGAVPFVELEYDLEGDVPVPWIGPAIRGSGSQRAHLDHTTARSAAVAVLDLLAAGWRDTPLFAHLGRCFDALAQHRGFVSHLTAHAARPSLAGHGVRAIVSLDRASLMAFLRDIGWPGDCDRVLAEDRYLSAFRPWADFDLDLDDAGPMPRMALYRGFVRPRADDEELGRLLASLSRRSLLPPVRHAAVTTWLGRVGGRRDRALTVKLGWSPQAAATVKLYFESFPEGEY